MRRAVVIAALLLASGGCRWLSTPSRVLCQTNTVGSVPTVCEETP